MKRLEHKAIVIDTEDYAGSFERELFCFITGHTIDNHNGMSRGIYEAYKGEVPADMYNWFYTHLRSPSLERNWESPVHIWPTPGWKSFGANGIYEFSKCKKGEKGNDPYLSVAIFVSEPPPKDVVDYVKKSAAEYSTLSHAHKDDEEGVWRFLSPVDITGFRYVKIFTEQESILL